MQPIPHAFVSGFGRVVRAPFILLALWVFSLLFALPLGYSVHDQLQRSFGRNPHVQERMLQGFDSGWEARFSGDGVAGTFDPGVTGAGAPLISLEAWLTGELFTEYPELLSIGAAYVLGWLVLLGGTLDRFARPAERSGFKRFFGAGGRYFFRFFRLAVLSAALYWAIYRLSWGAFELLEESTLEATVEGTALFYSTLIWGATALLLTFVHMAFGYAKIATVVGERKSMFLAALHGLGFVLRNPGRTFAVYYGLLVVSGLLLLAYGAFAPGASQSTVKAVVWAFAVGQLFLFAKLWMRLWLLAGQTALYVRACGHE